MVKKRECVSCALWAAKHFIRYGWPKPGDTYLCEGCGAKYRRAGVRWELVDTAADIKDLVAHHPLSEGRQ